MKILLTGVEWDYVGYIGPNLKEYLEYKGHKVINFVGDIRDPKAWDAYNLIQADFVVHLAARPNVRASWDNPHEVEDINVNGTKRCFEYAKRNNTKVLYASTSNAKEWWLNPYAMTKRIMEHLAEAYGIDSIGFRFHNVYPGRDDMIIKRLENGEALPYINVGMYRDFTHIEDLSSAILTIMENYETVKSKYDFVDIGTGGTYSVYEVIKKYWNSPIDIDSVEKIENVDTHGERWSTQANIDYLKELGWKPKHNILGNNE